MRVGGPLVSVDARRNIVVGDKLVALIGVEDLVVVVTEDAILVVPKERGQEVRQVVARLEQDRLDAYL